MTHREAGEKGWEVSRERNLAMREKQHQDAVRRYECHPRHCLHCYSKIPFGKRYNKFCNRTCRTKYWNCHRAHVSAKNKPTCPQCGISVRKKRCCSQKCWQQQRWKRTRDEIERTGTCEKPRVARKFLSEKYGCECSICGINNWQNEPLSLSVDHSDGDPTNNNILNLRLLCPNCHSQTPSYTGRNRGKGRVARRERDRLDYRRKNGWFAA